MPVRPVTRDEGLSQSESTDVLITEEGEIVPRGVHERRAAENEADSEDSLAQRVETEEQYFEEEQEEAEGKVRKAPKEPTREERMRHEATHLPYKSWCPVCVRGEAGCPHNVCTLLMNNYCFHQFFESIDQ